MSTQKETSTSKIYTCLGGVGGVEDEGVRVRHAGLHGVERVGGEGGEVRELALLHACCVVCIFVCGGVALIISTWVCVDLVCGGVA